MKTHTISCCGATGVKSAGAMGREAPLTQAEIPGLYDGLAPVYDGWAFFTESKARKCAIELSGLRDGETVLEVAVGTGLMFEQIVMRNLRGKNVGIDLSDGMLQKARERLARCAEDSYQLRKGNALELRVEDESIDLLMNSYMFDLLSSKDTITVLDEFARVLKPGGRVVIVNMTHGRSRASRVYELISRRFPRRVGGCRGVELAETLAQHGFEVYSVVYQQQCLFPSEIIVARKAIRP